MREVTGAGVVAATELATKSFVLLMSFRRLSNVTSVRCLVLLQAIEVRLGWQVINLLRVQN